MRTNKEILEKFANSPVVKSIGLTKDASDRLAKAYLQCCLDTLVENGYANISENFRIDIVKLTKRVHVLRGVTYSSARDFKLKLSIGDPIHDRIKEEYSQYE